jgi:heme a synthase
MIDKDQNEVVQKRFVRLALGGVIVTFLMIIIGAITRTTGSGMGCSTDWLTCNGQLVPELKSYKTAIEFGHRLFALLVGAFAVLVLFQARRHFRNQPRIIMPANFTVAFFLLQSAVGGLTVVLNNHWITVLFHLANGMFLLAAFVLTWVNARYADLAVSVPTQKGQSAIGKPLAIFAIVLIFAVAMIGAAVQGNGATKACVGWPLCLGDIWPAAQGPYQVLNMSHRLIAGSLGLLLIAMLWIARQDKNPVIRQSLWIALGFYLVQAAIGAAVVLLQGVQIDVITQALHVTFAAATWAVLIATGGLVWLQRQSSSAAKSKQEQVGASSAITSS